MLDKFEDTLTLLRDLDWQNSSLQDTSLTPGESCVASRYGSAKRVFQAAACVEELRSAEGVEANADIVSARS